MVIKINDSNNNNNNDFEISEEKINFVDKAAEYMGILEHFANWAGSNINDINVEKTFGIFEDFVKSNDHIIKKIKQLNLEN